MSTSPQTSSTADGTLSFITSNKGQRLLIRSDQVYRCNKKTDRKKYCKCIMIGCSIVVHSDESDIYLYGGLVEHDYELNLDLIQTTRFRQQMKERVLNELTPIRVIYDEEIMKASLNDSNSVRFLCDLVNSSTFLANYWWLFLTHYQQDIYTFSMFQSIDILIFDLLTDRYDVFRHWCLRYFDNSQLSFRRF